MFQVYGYSFNDGKVVKNYLDKEYAIAVFNSFITCEDAREVLMIDGLTGEVLFTREGGKFSIIDGYGVE